MKFFEILLLLGLVGVFNYFVYTNFLKIQSKKRKHLLFLIIIIGLSVVFVNLNKLVFAKIFLILIISSLIVVLDLMSRFGVFIISKNNNEKLNKSFKLQVKFSPL